MNKVRFRTMGRIVLLAALGLLMLWTMAAADDMEGRRAEVYVQMGHTGNVLAVAVAPDGRYGLSGGRDGLVKLWELDTGREVLTLTGHFAAVNAVAFLPDGKHALSGSSDMTLRLWDLETGQTIRVFQGSRSSVSTLAVGPEGRYALSSGLDPAVRLWDLESGTEVRRMDGHTDTVAAVAISPDGSTGLSASSDGAVRLWDLGSGREIRKISTSSPGPNAAGYSLDGRSIFAAGWDGVVRVWDAAGEGETGRFQTGIMIMSATFGPDNTIVIGGQDRTVTLWDAAGGLKLRTFTGHADQVDALALAPGRERLVSGSWDGTLRAWDLTAGREALVCRGLGGAVATVAVGPNGRTAVSGGNLAPALWDLSAGRAIARLAGHQGTVNKVVYSPDGRWILTAGQDAALILWDARDGSRDREFRGHEGSVESAAFTPDGLKIVSGSLDRTVRVWDVADGRELRVFSGYRDSVDILVVSPDGRFFLTEDSPDFIMQSLDDGREVRRFSGHGPGVEDLAFSPDGRMILSGSFDRTMKLWDTDSGRLIRTFKGHTDSVESVAFSPDGKTALSASWDAALRLWDLATGEERRVFQGHAGWATTAAFSRDGSRLFSGGEDGTARLWDAADGRELARFIGLEQGEWIVIIPEGYYAASPGGHGSVNVKVGPRVYGIDQFYDVFYRPDIVQHFLRGNDIRPFIRVTLDDALSRPPPVSQLLPLPEKTEADRIRIGFRVDAAGGGIGEVRIFHNGKLVRSDGFYRRAAEGANAPASIDRVDGRSIYEDLRDLEYRDDEAGPTVSRKKGDAYADSVVIEVAPGENTVSLCAFNDDNTIQGRMQTVAFQGLRAPGKASLYILAVGIDRYKDRRANLEYAAKDARDMAGRLAEAAAGLFAPDRISVRLLLDEEAIRDNILRETKSLAENVRIGDTVVLFFAGHGLLRGDQYQFVTHDYNGRIEDGCLIGSNDIIDMSTRLSALSQLFILDSCHAGGLDYIVDGLYDARMSVLAKKLGLHVFASCTSLQTALDGFQGNGLFTHNLLEGLRNRARLDDNGDRLVGMEEWGRYVREATARASAELGHPQTPTIIHFGRDIPLLSLP